MRKNEAKIAQISRILAERQAFPAAHGGGISLYSYLVGQALTGSANCADGEEILAVDKAMSIAALTIRQFAMREVKLAKDRDERAKN